MVAIEDTLNERILSQIIDGELLNIRRSGYHQILPLGTTSIAVGSQRSLGREPPAPNSIPSYEELNCSRMLYVPVSNHVVL